MLLHVQTTLCLICQILFVTAIYSEVLCYVPLCVFCFSTVHVMIRLSVLLKFAVSLFTLRQTVFRLFS